MTIAIISMIRDNWGGSEELWASMAVEALNQHHKVLHLSYETASIHPKLKLLKERGLISFTRPSYRGSSSNRLVQFTGKAKNFLRKKVNNSIKRIFEQQPDVIIYNGTCYSISQETSLLRELNKTKSSFYIIGHFNDERGRGGISEHEAQLTVAAYKRCRNVMFISRRSMKNAERQLVTDIENGIVVRNPVNISSTSIVPYPNNSKIQMAMVGNLRVVHKGQDIVLQALSGSEWRQRNWHLNIYGSGEDESYLRDTVDHLKLNDKVTFHGKVNDIRGVWEVNNILLMPSHMEGMPLAVVEAMLCGRICVGTDVGGISEWIDHGKNGFIADAPTVSSIMRTMEDAWIRLQDWEKMGIDAHQRAMQLYDPEPGKTLLKLITESII